MYVCVYDRLTCQRFCQFRLGGVIHLKLIVAVRMYKGYGYIDVKLCVLMYGFIGVG